MFWKLMGIRGRNSLAPMVPISATLSVTRWSCGEPKNRFLCSFLAEPPTPLLMDPVSLRLALCLFSVYSIQVCNHCLIS